MVRMGVARMNVEELAKVLGHMFCAREMVQYTLDGREEKVRDCMFTFRRGFIVSEEMYQAALEFREKESIEDSNRIRDRIKGKIAAAKVHAPELFDLQEPSSEGG